MNPQAPYQYRQFIVRATRIRLGGLALVMAVASASLLRADDPKPVATPTTMPSLVARTFVILALTDNPPKLDDAAAADLQRRHLAHISSMAASGKVLVAGPFSQRDDERIRGAIVFSCPIDEARTLANEDPAVKAGRLKVVCMNWNTAAEAMLFPAEKK